MNTLQDFGIHVVGCSYDGDASLSKEFTQDYLEHLLAKKHDRHGYSLDDWIRIYKYPIKVSDGLHALKRIKNFIMDT